MSTETETLPLRVWKIEDNETHHVIAATPWRALELLATSIWEPDEAATEWSHDGLSVDGTRPEDELSIRYENDADAPGPAVKLRGFGDDGDQAIKATMEEWVEWIGEEALLCSTTLP